MDLSNLIVSNAAGTAKTVADVAMLCRSKVTRIKVGTYTRFLHEGNGGDTYYFDPATKTGINSRNLPSEGLEPLIRSGQFGTMRSYAHSFGKALWASIVGDTPEEFADLAEMAFRAGADGVELDLGCPSRFKGDESVLPLSYDPAACEEVLDFLEARFMWEKRAISVKLSPVEDDVARDLATCIDMSGVITDVSAINTLRDQELVKPDGTPALSYYPPKSSTLHHRGAISGAPLKKDLMRLLPILSESLYRSIRLTACGGIFSGQDVFECMRAVSTHKENPCGQIHGYECATALIEEGPEVFARIQKECEELLEPA